MEEILAKVLQTIEALLAHLLTPAGEQSGALADAAAVFAEAQRLAVEQNILPAAPAPAALPPLSLAEAVTEAQANGPRADEARALIAALIGVPPPPAVTTVGTTIAAPGGMGAGNPPAGEAL